VSPSSSVERVDAAVPSNGEQPSRKDSARRIVAGQIGERGEKTFLRNILSLFPIRDEPESEPEDRLLMTVNKHTKVVRPSSKHSSY